jgi:type VI secretion system protein ImpG
MLEALALVTGRIHHKLDSEFPELTQALLEVLYPHLLRPVPAMAIAQFEVRPEAPPPPEGFVVPAQTRLHTLPLGDPPLSCKWRTGYPVALWPVRVAAAALDPRPTADAPPRTKAVLRLRLECLGGRSFADLPLDRLRFFLSGDSQMVASLYEALFHRTLRVAFRAPDRPGMLVELAPEECLHQVGLGADEGLLPIPEQSFVGHRLLIEFMSFPSKFLFLDLAGWPQVRDAGLGDKVEVLFFLDRRSEGLEQGVSAATFLLGCTPIVNLFAKSAEPIDVDQRRTEYLVVPDRACPRGMEVYSVDAVAGVDGGLAELVEYEPFYSFPVGTSRASRRAFFHATRRASGQEGDAGTEVYLSLVDRDWHPRRPADRVLHVQTTCTNRDYPSRFLRGRDVLVGDPSAPAPPGPVRCLSAPAAALRPPLRRYAHWRLLAQLGVNHKSLADPHEGLDTLREVLRLCDFTDAEPGSLRGAVNRQLVEGMTGLRARRALAAVSSDEGIGHVRGLEFLLELDEKKYVGVGVLLFSSVLERFLSLYAAVNSFSQLGVKTIQGEFARTWPPSSADRRLN